MLISVGRGINKITFTKSLLEYSDGMTSPSPHYSKNQSELLRELLYICPTINHVEGILINVTKWMTLAQINVYHNYLREGNMTVYL